MSWLIAQQDPGPFNDALAGALHVRAASSSTPNHERTGGIERMAVRIGINVWADWAHLPTGGVGEQRLAVEVVAVNDLTDARTLATLLEWDSVSGHLTACHSTAMRSPLILARLSGSFCARRPWPKIPWGEVEADVVIESTGHFTGWRGGGPSERRCEKGDHLGVCHRGRPDVRFGRQRR